MARTQFSTVLGLAAAIGVTNTGGANSQSAIASNYTFGSAGSGVCYRFVAPSATTLTKVAFYVAAKLGSPGNMRIELRNASSVTVPGSTVHATDDVAAPSGTGWYEHTFSSPFTLTPGTIYYITIMGVSGYDGSNNFSVKTVGNIGTVSNQLYFRMHSTSNGFSTATNVSTTAAVVGVLVLGNGTLIGLPYISSAVDTNDTNERGLLINRLDFDIRLYGVEFGIGGVTNPAGMKVYAPGAAPGGTALLDLTFASLITSIGFVSFDPILLRAGEQHRIVFTGGSNFTGPGYYDIDGTPGSDVKACGFFNGKGIHTVQSGGSWVDTDTRFPKIRLIMDSIRGFRAYPSAGMGGVNN